MNNVKGKNLFSPRPPWWSRVNHLSDVLEELDCGDYCGIDQKGMYQLKKLRILKCLFNEKIKDINNMVDYTGNYLLQQY